MTRTTIITAQGERLTPEGRTKILIRRWLIILTMIFTALMISAAVIGFAKAATAHTPANRPSSKEFAILHNAEKKGGKNCRLEWNEVQGDHEVICDGKNPLDSLIALWNRAPHTAKNSDGSTISDPSGKELVAECLDDSSLSRGELIACLNQPAN